MIIDTKKDFYYLDEFNPYFQFQIILKRIMHKTALFLAKIELTYLHNNHTNDYCWTN